MSHTKGPWTRIGTSVYFADRLGGFDLHDCPDAEGNAQACSAVPELLLAAEAVAEAWGKFIDSFNYVPGIGDTAENIEFQEMMRLRMTINKAKGITQ